MRAKAALEAWEATNHIEAAVQAPAKVAVADAEREAVAARAAKERHQLAIAHGVMPMAMEREEGQQLMAAARKV